MISMTHLAFSSTDPLATTTEAEMEKVCGNLSHAAIFAQSPFCRQSVDKLGRTARRTLDTHVKNALSRPLLATTLRRITAMFNFVPELRTCLPSWSLMMPLAQPKHSPGCRRFCDPGSNTALSSHRITSPSCFEATTSPDCLTSSGPPRSRGMSHGARC